MDVVEAFRTQSSRARLVAWLLGICAALAAASVASGVAQYALLERAAAGGLSEAEANANDVRQGAVAIVQLLGVVVTGVAWCRWAHRAHANLALMGHGRSLHTPAAAVYSWFIPILNLYRPYQVTKELWLRSRDGNTVVEVRGQPGPGILAAWWAAWIVTSVMGQYVFRASQAKTIPELQSATVLSGISDVTDLVAALLALAVVRRIDAYQRSASVAAHAVQALS